MRQEAVFLWKSRFLHFFWRNVHFIKIFQIIRKFVTFVLETERGNMLKWNKNGPKAYKEVMLILYE